MTSERPVIGLYCLIFALYWRIQLKRANRWKGVLLYALTANFILCSAYLIVDIIGVQSFITVSHIQIIHHFSNVMASDMSGVQLTFEFPECGEEGRPIKRFALAEHYQ